VIPLPVRATAVYSTGVTTISNPTTLTVLNTAPTAVFAADGPIDEGGTASVRFTSATDPSNADRVAGLRYSVDFNATIQGGGDPVLVSGTQVNAQFWFRDTASSFGSGLTNAVDFVIQP